MNTINGSRDQAAIDLRNALAAERRAYAVWQHSLPSETDDAYGLLLAATFRRERAEARWRNLCDPSPRTDAPS